jgi:hypothetical protein
MRVSQLILIEPDVAGLQPAFQLPLVAVLRSAAQAPGEPTPEMVHGQTPRFAV